MKQIVKREDLCKLITSYCKENYNIGFHGIANYRLNGKDVDTVSAEIIEKGLNIYDNHSLLGTVQFNDKRYFNSDVDFINNYTYGDTTDYIIVAIPKLLKNENGDEIFVGSPSYNDMTADQSKGYEFTSLSDTLIPDYNENINNLNSMFILGKLKVSESDVEFELNNKHIINNNDLCPDDFFQERFNKLKSANEFYGIEKNFSINNDNSNDEVVNYLSNVYSKLNTMSDDELKILEDKLSQYDFQTQILISNYPHLIKNDFSTFKSNNALIDKCR